MEDSWLEMEASSFNQLVLACGGRVNCPHLKAF